MTPLVMGILNVTPDSFYDGGRFDESSKAISHGLEMAGAGADIVDVGGESTRPGAEPVAPEEELARVVPVVEALAPHVRVSIDTRKQEVAEAAIRAGASILNDVSSSLHEVAARTGAGWVAMHMAGDPRTMQRSPNYGDVVDEVGRYLFERATAAHEAGVREIWIDPGIGFGKTFEHNLSLLKHLETLTMSPWPVALGVSRKSFLGVLSGSKTSPAPVEDRLEGSLAVAIKAALQGVSLLRVHDVAETVRALKVLDAIGDAA